MGWTQATDYIHEEWVRPKRVFEVKKQIWDSGKNEFVHRTFYRVECRTGIEYSDTQKWLEEQYGPPKLQGLWWTTSNNRHIWMSESLITFWLLKNPDRN